MKESTCGPKGGSAQVKPSIFNRKASLRLYERGAFFALLAAALAMTLLQRSFPSQDGPLHLYYIDVLADLLRGSGFYGTFFTIKHLIPPYAFHAYVLLALNTVFDPLVSEKILVAGYIAWFCAAFRYLVHSVDPENDWAPLLAFPLGLNRMLFLGFYNFCFGVATAVFLAGYWIRNFDRLTWKRTLTLTALVALLAFMHPMALLLGVMFIGLHTAVLLWTRAREQQWKAALAGSRRVVLHAIWAAAPLAWIAAYTTASRVGLDPPKWFRVFTFAFATTLAPFRPTGYRGPLALVSVAILVLAALRLFRRDRGRPADLALALAGAACLAVYVVAPPDMNYNAHVPDRFPIFGTLFLAAFAAGRRLSPRLERAALVALAGVSVYLLGWQFIGKQRIIDLLRPVYDAPVAQARVRAALVADHAIQPYGAYPNNFTPWVWAGAHYLRRSKALFMNFAWLRSPVMIVQPRQPSPCGYEDPYPMLECLQVAGFTRWGRPDVLVAVEPRPVLASELARDLELRPVGPQYDWLHVWAK
jgi:hypothetical protein